MPDLVSDISRVTRSHEDAQRAYDRISRWYDLLEGGWERRVRAAGLGKLNLARGETVLEIGCGTGQTMLDIATLVGNPGRAYAVDLSPRMLAIAQGKLERANLAERSLFVCGDAVRLPFACSSVDAIFMSFTLELFDTPEIPQVLLECRRVLHGGGRLCVVSLSRSAGLNWMGRLYEWGHHHLPALLDCRLIYVRRALQEASFTVSDATTISLYGLPVEVVLAHRAYVNGVSMQSA